MRGLWKDAKISMQKKIDEAVDLFKESEEYQEEVGKYYYLGRVETVERLKAKNPNLDLNDLDDEASQKTNQEPADSHYSDPQPLQVEKLVLSLEQNEEQPVKKIN